MEHSEKYTILIENNTKKIDISDVEKLWAQLALDEFQKSNIFISAIIDTPMAICNPAIGCDEYYTQCIRIVCTRMPNLCSDSNKYLSCLHQIFLDLKKHYDNPYIVVESCPINLSFFPPY